MPKSNAKNEVISGFASLPSKLAYAAIVVAIGSLFSYSLTFSYSAEDGEKLKERVVVIERIQAVSDEKFTHISESLDRIEKAMK